mgnify:CR=1 FL=1
MVFLDMKQIMMKRKIVFSLLLLPLMLIGCFELPITADTFAWIREERLLFKDTFAENSGGWKTHEDTLSYAGYQEGGFRLWADVPNYQFWSVPGLNFRDTQVVARARVLAGPDDNMFGLLCRYQDENNYYALVIGADGYYGIFKNLDGEHSLIDQQHMDFSEEINRGKNENKLQAVCQNDHLSLFVNGTMLLQVQDESLAYGDIGLIVGNFAESGVDVLFDDFIVVSP